MIKIALIGGGSVMWTPGLVNDLALTGTLAETELVLHDVDSKALDFMLPVAKRIVEQFSTNIAVTATEDRKEALQDADFVILCVAIGGLDETRNDLEIPEKYGIRQSVGDTVGPGGLARGLRHIPFAIRVAREMEQLCPDAWLLNLTNPMSTICRGITRATSTPTIGLCHEVTSFRDRLATLFGAPAEQILLEVAGINHLPIITRCDVDGQDGFALLHKWLSKHDPYELVEGGDLNIVLEVFIDHLAVKLTLFQRLGVLFGAGDRHVAEFLTGFLTEQDSWGRKYGIHLTTADHREELKRLRQDSLEYYAPSKNVSQEQLAPVIAALLGRPPGEFTVNVPNQGQIDNLPRDAVVECVAHIDTLGVRPLAVGSLPLAARAIIGPHVDRQEMIVEAALTGRYELAKAALASDPMIKDVEVVEPLFDELLAANLKYIEEHSE